jgi:hypothetical protein
MRAQKPAHPETRVSLQHGHRLLSPPPQASDCTCDANPGGGRGEAEPPLQEENAHSPDEPEYGQCSPSPGCTVVVKVIGIGRKVGGPAERFPHNHIFSRKLSDHFSGAKGPMFAIVGDWSDLNYGSGCQKWSCTTTPYPCPLGSIRQAGGLPNGWLHFSRGTCKRPGTPWSYARIGVRIAIPTPIGPGGSAAGFLLWRP